MIYSKEKYLESDVRIFYETVDSKKIYYKMKKRYKIYI